MKTTLSLMMGLLVFAPVSAAACGPAPKSLVMRLSGVQTNPDCSFTNAGKGRMGFGRGEEALNLGQGNIAQLVRFGDHGCAYEESAIVANCTTKELVILEGLESDSCCYGEKTSVKSLQPPEGPIVFSANSTIENLEQTAIKNGIDHSRSFKNWLTSKPVARAFDPFCGCSLFYPDTPGAKS